MLPDGFLPPTYDSSAYGWGPYGLPETAFPSQDVTWEEFFQAIADYLASQNVFGPGSSFWAEEPDSVIQWPSGPPPFGLIVPMGMHPSGDDIGAGRFNKLWEVAIDIHIVVGNVYDQAFRDSSLVTSASIGIGPYALATLLGDKMEQAYITTEDGNYATSELPRSTGIGRLHRFSQTNAYVSIPVSFEMAVKQSLPSTWIPSGTPPTAADLLAFADGWQSQ